MRLLPVILLMLIAGVNDTHERWVVSDKSNVIITGSSNVNKFNCLMVEYSQSEELHSWEDKHGFKFDPGVISLKINKFDCGHPVMNKDFAETLDAKDHPYILLKLKQIDLRTELNGLGVFSVEIAGEEKHDVIMELNMYKTIDTFVLKGKKQFLMSDFGIDPPSKLFGLIQVDDIIVIDFDLVLKRAE